MALPSEKTLLDIATETGRPWGLFPLRVKTVEAGPHSTVTVIVDSESDPAIDAVGEFSTALSQVFDEKEASKELSFGAGYNLEVSTPGIDEPLTRPYQWARNRGRAVSVTLKGQEPATYRIGALSPEEDRVVLIYSEGTKGNKKAKKTIVALHDVERAVVEIEFNGAPKNEAALSQEPFEE